MEIPRTQLKFGFANKFEIHEEPGFIIAWK